jgi:hypothetical protein
LGQPLEHFDAVVLPRGDPHLKIIRSRRNRAPRTWVKAWACITTRGSSRSCCKTTRATKHRVVSPPPEREQLSIAYSFHPRLDAVSTRIAERRARGSAIQ